MRKIRIYNRSLFTLSQVQKNTYLKRRAGFSTLLEPIRLPSLDGSHMAKIHRYTQDLKALLATMGINLTGSLRLQIGQDGRFVVEGSSLDKEKIENLLNEDTCLKALGKNLRTEMCLQSHAEMIQQALKFQRMYRLDPKAAMARYGHLLNNGYSVKIIVEIKGNSVKIETKENYGRATGYRPA